jgi:hypothetical protein
MSLHDVWVAKMTHGVNRMHGIPRSTPVIRPHLKTCRRTVAILRLRPILQPPKRHYLVEIGCPVALGSSIHKPNSPDPDPKGQYVSHRWTERTDLTAVPIVLFLLFILFSTCLALAGVLARPCGVHEGVRRLSDRIRYYSWLSASPNDPPIFRR